MGCLRGISATAQTAQADIIYWLSLLDSPAAQEHIVSIVFTLNLWSCPKLPKTAQTAQRMMTALKNTQFKYVNDNYENKMA